MRGRKVLPTVQILNKLFGPSTRNLERAMDRATLRQSVLSANLANINTPGYKRRDVDFAIELEKAEGSHLRAGHLPGSPIHTDRAAIRIDGNSVDLEREVYALAETELRYQTLAQLARGYFSSLRNVIRGGR